METGRQCARPGCGLPVPADADHRQLYCVADGRCSQAVRNAARRERRRASKRAATGLPDASAKRRPPAISTPARPHLPPAERIVEGYALIWKRRDGANDIYKCHWCPWWVRVQHENGIVKDVAPFDHGGECFGRLVDDDDDFESPVQQAEKRLRAEYQKVASPPLMSSCSSPPSAPTSTRSLPPCTSWTSLKPEKLRRWYTNALLPDDGMKVETVTRSQNMYSCANCNREIQCGSPSWIVKLYPGAYNREESQFLPIPRRVCGICSVFFKAKRPDVIRARFRQV